MNAKLCFYKSLPDLNNETTTTCCIVNEKKRTGNNSLQIPPDSNELHRSHSLGSKLGFGFWVFNPKNLGFWVWVLGSYPNILGFWVWVLGMGKNPNPNPKPIFFRVPEYGGNQYQCSGNLISLWLCVTSWLALVNLPVGTPCRQTRSGEQLGNWWRVNLVVDKCQLVSWQVVKWGVDKSSKKI